MHAQAGSGGGKRDVKSKRTKNEYQVHGARYRLELEALNLGIWN